MTTTEKEEPPKRGRSTPDPNAPITDYVTVGLTKHARAQVEELRDLFREEEGRAFSLSESTRKAIEYAHRVLVALRARAKANEGAGQ